MQVDVYFSFVKSATFVNICLKNEQLSPKKS